MEGEESSILIVNGRPSPRHLATSLCPPSSSTGQGGQGNGPERATVALSVPTSTMSTAQKVKLDSIAALR